MDEPIILGFSLYRICMYFFIYGFLGWAAEVVYATLKTGKFVNRGFLNGPICPIYGVGMAVCIVLLTPFRSQWWALFVAGGIFATVLEFCTGFVLEKIFKTKWWDYSKEHFNVKGYVCLKFSILWGLAIMVLFGTIVSTMDAVIEFVPFRWWGCAVLILLVTTFAVDVAGTIVQLKKLNEHLKELTRTAYSIKKNSDFIGEKISGATLTVKKTLDGLGEKIKKSRFGKAFPAINDKHREASAVIEEQEKTILARQTQLDKFPAQPENIGRDE